jgi:hypothetical protein
LANFRFLVHHSDQADPDLIVNKEDIAFASLSDSSIVAENVVPDPNNPQRLLPVVDAMSPTELGDHTHKDVFLVGRTTAFAAGKLVATDSTEMPIQMPNGRNYMFNGLALVESADKDHSFSQGGDSGAMVYAIDGGECRALGFVVGGNQRYTYIVPASTCLTAMKAALL